jgi:hypothetical protein
MLDDKVKVLSESLARALDRRRFIKSTGTAMFATIAAAAAGHFSVARASASLGSSKGSSDTQPPPWPPQCAPPGPYCNITGVSDGSGCAASRPYEPSGSCFQHRVNGVIRQCVVIYNWYQAGCWTTPVSGGRWTCCDCGCGGSMCGCAQFSTSPPPRPDSPLGAGADA